MKRTKITIYDDPESNEILIQKIENCATIKDIESAFGKEVRKRYCTDYPNYQKRITSSITSPIMHLGKDSFIAIKEGDLIHRNKFYPFVKHMVDSGNRLGKIKIDVIKDQTKVIVI